MSFERGIIYEDDYLKQSPSAKSYTTADLRRLGWEYVTDATSASRSVADKDIINKFLDWLDRESKSK